MKLTLIAFVIGRFVLFFKYQNNFNRQQNQLREEYIQQLEQENERLIAENRSQREDYERFLERLTPMVFRTAMMQEVRICP